MAWNTESESYSDIYTDENSFDYIPNVRKLIKRTASIGDAMQEIQGGYDSPADRINAIDYGNSGDFVGMVTVASVAPPSNGKHIAIPYPDGLTSLNKITYEELYATVSDTDAALWTEEASGTSNDLYAALYTPSGYIAVGGGNAVQRYSLDGETWSAGAAGSFSTGGAPQALAYNPAVPDSIVAVGTDNSIWYSTTGVAGLFNKITSPLTSLSPNWQITDVKFSNGLFWAVAYRQSGATTITSAVIYSATGADGTWSVANSAISGQYQAIAYDGTTILIVGYGDFATTASRAKKSIDAGATWNSAGSLPIIANDINVFASLFYCAGSGGGIYYTTDLSNWSQITNPHTSELNFVRYDSVNNRIIFGGEPFGGLTYIYSVSDFVLTLEQTASATLNDYAENGYGQSVIVGSSGKIYSFAAYSGNFDIASTVEVTGDTESIKDICVGAANIYVTAGGAFTGQVWASSDNGATWTLESTPPISGKQPKIIYDSTNGNYIIWGYDPGGFASNVYTSPTPDGTWTDRGTIAGAYENYTPWMAHNGSGLTALLPNAGSALSADYGRSWTSTDGGINWTIHDSPGLTANTAVNARRAKYIGGYFVLSSNGSTADTGKIFYSTDGYTWSEVQPSGASLAVAFCDISYIAGKWVYVNSGTTTDVWTADAIGGPYTQETLTGGYAVRVTGTTSTETILFAVGNALVAIMSTNPGGVQTLCTSTDGVAWSAVTDNYTPSIVVSNGNNTVTFISGDTVHLSTYSANQTSDTFDFLWPWPGQQLSAQLNAYVRAFA